MAVSPNGGNCVLKAILMSSATKLPYWHKGRLTTDDDHEVPLDYVQGAGVVNAARAYQLLTAGRGQPGDVAKAGWDLNQIEAAADAGAGVPNHVERAGPQSAHRHADLEPPLQ